MRILIIDDEESMRHMLSIILKKEGYEVVSAESGQQALKVLGKDDFNFILCDIRMPDMDGLEFLRRLKTQDARHEIKDLSLEPSAFSPQSSACSHHDVCLRHY